MDYVVPTYMAQLRETGDRRHQLLGTNCLTNRRVHANRFIFSPDAMQAIEWMFENNPGAFDSGKVVQSGKVIATYNGEDWTWTRAGRTPAARRFETLESAR